VFLERIDGSESPRIRRVSDRAWRHRRFQSDGRRVCGNSKDAISLLDRSEWAGLLLVQQRYRLVQQGLDVVQSFGDLESLHHVFIEVLLQQDGASEQPADVSVAGLRPESADRKEVDVVPAVFPAALFCDSVEDLNSGAPALLGRLGQIAVGEFAPGLHDEMLTGLPILLGDHLGLLLLLRRLASQTLLGNVAGAAFMMMLEWPWRNRLNSRMKPLT